MKRHYYLLTASLALLSTPMFGQGNIPNATYEGPTRLNTWSISLQGGPTQFFGDLREYDF